MNTDPLVGLPRSTPMAVTTELAPRRSQIMSKLITLLLLAALVVGGLYVYQTHFAKGASTQPTTTNAIVARGNIFQAVASTGRVVSNHDVEIKCKAAGQIIELPYDVSQEVKKDALILQIDPIDQQRAVRQAEVELL